MSVMPLDVSIAYLDRQSGGKITQAIQGLRIAGYSWRGIAETLRTRNPDWAFSYETVRSYGLRGGAKP